MVIGWDWIRVVGNGVCAGFEKNWVGKWMRCSTDIQKFFEILAVRC